MKNEQTYLITVLFPAWSYKEGSAYETEHRGNGKDTYPAFGVKYLIDLPVQDYYEEEVRDKFIEKFQDHFDRAFDGQIVFIEAYDVVILK